MNRRKKNSTKSTEHAPRMPNTECRHSARHVCILAEGAIALSVTLSGRALVPSGCSRQLSAGCLGSPPTDTLGGAKRTAGAVHGTSSPRACGVANGPTDRAIKLFTWPFATHFHNQLISFYSAA